MAERGPQKAELTHPRRQLLVTSIASHSRAADVLPYPYYPLRLQPTNAPNYMSEITLQAPYEQVMEVD
jgi:hypothetical protein